MRGDEEVRRTAGCPTVGIPQALLYYKYFPMWRALFESLSWRVISTEPTTHGTVRRGTELGENELCLPVKVFFGHVAELDGNCDAIFVPRVVSVQRREYTCPKFLGLPDMTRIHGYGTPLLSPTFDMRDSSFRYLRQHYDFARSLGAGRARAAQAVARALRAQRDHDRYLARGDHLRLPERAASPGAIGAADGSGGVADETNTAVGPVRRPDQRLRIGVAGHPYNIYDPHVSQDLIRRLAEADFDVITSDMVTARQVDKAVEDLPKSLFWTYEKEVVGAVAHWMRNGLVDGVVYVLSFACGPDSIVQTLIEDEVRSMPDAAPVPLLSLVIDEHSGEAGFVTRIEAFTDMLRMRLVEEPAGAVARRTTEAEHDPAVEGAADEEAERETVLA